MIILLEIRDCVKISDIGLYEGGDHCVNIADRRRGSDRLGRRPPTRLQHWLNANGFTSAQLEKASGIARQSMTKIRAGADTRKRTMLRILAAARTLKGPEVQMSELFDLEPEGFENTP